MAVKKKKGINPGYIEKAISTKQVHASAQSTHSYYLESTHNISEET